MLTQIIVVVAGVVVGAVAGVAAVKTLRSCIILVCRGRGRGIGGGCQNSSFLWYSNDLWSWSWSSCRFQNQTSLFLLYDGCCGLVILVGL